VETIVGVQLRFAACSSIRFTRASCILVEVDRGRPASGGLPPIPWATRTRQDATPAETWILIGTVPALIKQEDFERVQVKLALNKKQATRNNKRYSYLLRALVSCGACPSACIARTTNGGLRTSVAAKPSRSTRSMINGVVRDAFPLSSWMFWCGRTCAGSVAAADLVA